MKTLSDKAQEALNAVEHSKLIAYDTETTGIDWRRDCVVGYVITASPDDNWYIPVRHAGGGNLNDTECPPAKGTGEKYYPHKFESELAKAFAERRSKSFKTIMHNAKFDIHMSANHDIDIGRCVEDTGILHALIDEYSRTFSLDGIAEYYGATAKKGEKLYNHLAQKFGGESTRNQMKNFWRLSGDDPIGNEYAMGDGITTLEVWKAQQKYINEEHYMGTVKIPTEEGGHECVEKRTNLRFVADMENELIYTVFRMERRGVCVDTEYLEWLIDHTNKMIQEARSVLPEGLNIRSGLQVRKWMEQLGRTDWPTTPIGNPSFTEKWLKGFEEGRAIIRVRQITNLQNSFIMPLRDEHLFKGRIHPSFNQMKTDNFGTVTGRFSCNSPNIQQVPKRNKELGRLFRALFIPPEGELFYEGDYSQCFVAGTKVSVPACPEYPNGEKNIEDIEPGDWVYTFDHGQGKPTLSKALCSGKTGSNKDVYRLKWRTNGGRKGEVIATGDHRFYLSDGGSMSVEEMMAEKGNHRIKALSRHDMGEIGRRTHGLLFSGSKGVQEHRFIFKELHGYAPEEVHHTDGDNRNNTPNNLQGVSKEEHRLLHKPNGVDPEEIIRLLKKGHFKTDVAVQLGCTVHAVEYWRSKLAPELRAKDAPGRLDKNKLRYFFEKRLPTTFIAKQMRCEEATVRYYKRRWGKGVFDTPKRPEPSNKKPREDILQYLADGNSISATARKFDCSRKLVTLIQKEAANHIVYEIEYVGESDVYCISVEDTRCFYANELLAMNCEPRLFAHYSKDKNLVEGYNSKPFRDAHSVVAELLNVERDPTAKRMNMGIFTGMQARAFADHMGWTLIKASEIWDRWFKEFPGVKNFQNGAKNAFRSRGFVTTILGRMCRLDDPRFAYRATSRIIQGSNADIIKYKMLEVDKWLESNGDIIKLILTIHDSFGWTAPDTPEANEMLEEMVRMFEEIQGEPFGLRVPFVMDVGKGPNWAVATYGEI